MRRLRWQAIVGPGQVFHVAHARVGRGPESVPHGHDFAEVFWVVGGAGWHVVGGPRVALRPGDLVLITPEDAHGFETAAGGLLDIVNVAFPREVYAHALERYAASAGLRRLRQALPRAPLRLEAEQVEALEGAALELQRAEPGLAAIDRFLLTLLRIVSPPDGLPGADQPMPAWLRGALLRLQDPGAIEGGLPAFLRAAGRSPEHVARTCRSCLGRTPTELVNEVRLEHAAGRLRSTHAPVGEIALACGFGNLSHFHHLFRGRFGESPRAHRLRHQQALLPGAATGARAGAEAR